MIFGAILAGGVGSRMGEDIPKQFLEIEGKPIILYSLEKFLRCRRMDQIIIGVSEPWFDFTQNLVQTTYPENAHRIHIILGGNTRNDTLQKLIAAVDKMRCGDPNDIIVTQEAARPFVTMRMIEENIDAAIQYGAVNTVSPVIDTIVMSEDGKTITDIPNKTFLYSGHTPQSFRIDLLKELYATLTQDEINILTDACKICCLRGHEVALVKSEYTNLKITTPGDYLIAKAYIAAGVHLQD